MQNNHWHVGLYVRALTGRERAVRKCSGPPKMWPGSPGVRGWPVRFVAQAMSSAVCSPSDMRKSRQSDRPMALQVVARYGGVVEQPELVRYVNLVGRAVANTSDRPDIPYRVAILEHESINAFAAPAGYIFITRGLLKQIRNEAELPRCWGMKSRM